MRKTEERIRDGTRLREIREELGLSRSQLAGRIGASAVTIRNVENGLQSLGQGKWHKVEVLAGLRPSRLALAVEASSSQESPQNGLARAFQEAANPAIARAASAMVDATGMPREEALAILVERKMRGR